MEYFIENKTVKREFRIQQNHLISGPVENKLSGDVFVPDGNGSEFTIRFTDGEEISSKSVALSDIRQEKDGTIFTFEEKCATTVRVAFQSSGDGKYIKKRIMISQTQERPIDYILLENVGIINSKSHFTVKAEDQEDFFFDGYYYSLGQPFYIDSFFYGCEFPATSNKIRHGLGYVKYYLGKSIAPGKIFKFPITVLGAAKGRDMTALQTAFFAYIESISTKTSYRVQYNSWYDHMLDITPANIRKSFFEIEKGLTRRGVPTLDAYVIDDGWNDYRSDFWNLNRKFEDGLFDYTRISRSLGSRFGLWFGPRGGYTVADRFAKRIEKSGNGYFNKESKDICIGSEKYVKNAEEFLVQNTLDYEIDYWKLDGFCLKPCKDPTHDHITGGYKEMYYITEMWSRWINVFVHLKKARPGVFLNMTSYVTPSPWWLKYVDCLWLQSSNDIGFADNEPQQRKVEAEITYRDNRYWDFLCKRGLQFPPARLYNHEPIYGNTAKISYTDREFEKYLFSNAVRGQAFNELYLSYNMLNDAKWNALAKVLTWARENYHILKNVHFLGGDPAENNVYEYTAWTEDGEGIVALRNPSSEPADVTVTLNKLMGVPETLQDAVRYNVYDDYAPDTQKTFSYNQKMDVTLLPYEFKLYQFGKTDRRYKGLPPVNEFTISFTCNEDDCTICENDDIRVQIEDGSILFTVDGTTLRSSSETVIGKDAFLVRERNKCLKIYVAGTLDSALCDQHAKDQISTKFADSPLFTLQNKALAYDEIPQDEKAQPRKWFKL